MIFFLPGCLRLVSYLNLGTCKTECSTGSCIHQGWFSSGYKSRRVWWNSCHWESEHKVTRDTPVVWSWLLASNYYSLFNYEIRDSFRTELDPSLGDLVCPVSLQPLISDSSTLLLIIFTILFTMYLTVLRQLDRPCSVERCRGGLPYTVVLLARWTRCSWYCGSDHRPDWGITICSIRSSFCHKSPSAV